MYNKLKIVFVREKDKLNQLKHDGLSLAEAADLEWDDAAYIQDQRHDYRESRIVAFPYLADRLCVVVFVDRDEQRRIISLRKANYREVRRYAKT
jgi:uncharacterized DUF497 family protein